ncbi:MAG: hypothetical protein SHS37scaffold220_19 [Phage 67_12]|nr:MAG: hypothetical protein SHS37scaffold220_19 [Phage 67_12]
MKRDLLPGRWNRHGRAIPDAQASELDNVHPIRPDLPPIRLQVTGGPVPLRTRARRFARALFEFLTAHCFRP